jgi:hypothetical protein
MRHPRSPGMRFAVLTVLALPLAARASWLSDFLGIGRLFEDVVAEQTDPATAPAPPTALTPTFYLEHAGGFVEVGMDPVANDPPPPPAVVLDEVHQALTAQHYLPAAPGHPASLVLIYSWGVMREQDFPGRELAGQRARLMLVAPKKQAADVFQDVADNSEEWGFHFPIIDPMKNRLLSMISDDRYFVVISAYDCASVARNHPRLVWRVRMSTWANGASMADSFPTLLRGGAPYIGRNFDAAQFLSIPKVRAGTVTVGAPRVIESAEDRARAAEPAPGRRATEPGAGSK